MFTTKELSLKALEINSCVWMRRRWGGRIGFLPASHSITQNTHWGGCIYVQCELNMLWLNEEVIIVFTILPYCTYDASGLVQRNMTRKKIHMLKRGYKYLLSSETERFKEDWRPVSSACRTSDLSSLALDSTWGVEPRKEHIQAIQSISPNTRCWLEIHPPGDFMESVVVPPQLFLSGLSAL